MNKKMTRFIGIAAVLLLLLMATVGAASADTFTVKVNSVATIEESGGNTYNDPAGGSTIVLKDSDYYEEVNVAVCMEENGDINIRLNADGDVIGTLTYVNSNSGTDNKFGVIPSGAKKE